MWKKAYLLCYSIREGMFSNEYLIEFRDYSGKLISFFCDKDMTHRRDEDYIVIDCLYYDVWHNEILIKLPTSHRDLVYVQSKNVVLLSERVEEDGHDGN